MNKTDGFLNRDTIEMMYSTYRHNMAGIPLSELKMKNSCKDVEEARETARREFYNHVRDNAEYSPFFERYLIIVLHNACRHSGQILSALKMEDCPSSFLWWWLLYTPDMMIGNIHLVEYKILLLLQIGFDVASHLDAFIRFFRVSIASCSFACTSSSADSTSDGRIPNEVHKKKCDGGPDCAVYMRDVFVKTLTTIMLHQGTEISVIRDRCEKVGGRCTFELAHRAFTRYHKIVTLYDILLFHLKKRDSSER